MLAACDCSRCFCIARFVAGAVDGETALARDVVGEIDREAVGVVELEDRLAVDGLRGAELRDGRVEDDHAGLERARELLAFLEQHVAHARLLLDELGKCLAHHLDQRGHQLVEERRALAELVAVTHGAPRDATQYVATAFVRRHHAVDDEEAAGADVIRDHAQARVGELGGVEQTSRPRG